MRSANRCQARDSVGHSFVDDHVARIEPAHAVSNDVNLFGARACECFIYSASQLFCSEIDRSSEVLIRMENLEAVGFQIRLDQLEVLKSIFELSFMGLELCPQFFQQDVESRYSMGQDNREALSRHFIPFALASTTVARWPVIFDIRPQVLALNRDGQLFI